MSSAGEPQDNRSEPASGDLVPIGVAGRVPAAEVYPADSPDAVLLEFRLRVRSEVEAEIEADGAPEGPGGVLGALGASGTSCAPGTADSPDSDVVDSFGLLGGSRDGVRSVVFPAMSAAVSAVGSMRAVAAMDPASLSADERLGVLDALESVDRMLAGASMRHLVAVDDHADLDARFGMAVGGYAEQRYGKKRLTWVSSIRRGRALMRDLPLVFDALLDGRISRERAELFANVVNPRNAAVLEATQAELLDLSDAEPRFREFAHQLQALASIADSDGKEPDASQSSARMSRSGNHLALVVDVYGDDAVALEQLILVAVSALRRRWEIDVEQCPELQMPSAPQLREQAIAELLIRGAGADPAASKPTVARLSLIVDADRVDDLDPMLASVLSGIGFAGFSASRPGGPSLRLVNPFTGEGGCAGHGDGGDGGHDGTDAPLDPRAGGAGDGVACGGCGDHHRPPAPYRDQQFLVSTPDGDRVELTAQQFQLLLCDADISEVLLDALGEPVAVRDRVRLAGTKMRTALIARDGGCAFPGCDAPAGWCDAHHVIEYAKGGRTVIVNLVLLCRRHHGIVHRLGWRMERNSAPGDDDGGNRSGSGDHDLGRSGHAAGQRRGFFKITTAGGLQLTTQHRPRTLRPDEPPGEPPGRLSVPA